MAKHADTYKELPLVICGSQGDKMKYIYADTYVSCFEGLLQMVQALWRRVGVCCSFLGLSDGIVGKCNKSHTELTKRAKELKEKCNADYKIPSVHPCGGLRFLQALLVSLFVFLLRRLCSRSLELGRKRTLCSFPLYRLPQPSPLSCSSSFVWMLHLCWEKCLKGSQAFGHHLSWSER